MNARILESPSDVAEWKKATNFVKELHELRKSVSCAICLDFFRDPQMLNECGHIFCQACLENSLHKFLDDTNSNSSAMCPLCCHAFSAAAITASSVHVRRSRRSSNGSITKPPLSFIIAVSAVQRLVVALDAQPTAEEYTSAIQENARKEGMLRREREREERMRRRGLIDDNIGIPPMVGFPPDALFVDKGCHASSVSVALAETGYEKADIAEMVDRHASVLGKGLETESASTAQHPRLSPPLSLIPPVDAVPVLASWPHPGDVVNVQDRCWVGVNRPGGAAWVTAVHFDADTSVDTPVAFDVRYVLDNRIDRNVIAAFVNVVEQNLAVRPKRKASVLTANTGSPTLEKTPVKSKDNDIQHQNKENSGQKATSGRKASLSALPVAKTCSRRSALADTPVGKIRTREEPDVGRWFILDTDLSHAERLELDELAHKFAHTAKTTPSNVCLERETLFSRRITHLVGGAVVRASGKSSHDSANSSPYRYFLRKRTWKYLQCLLHGVVIVSSAWVSDSLRAGKLLPCEAYEVCDVLDKNSVPDAPCRARKDCLQHGGSTLFATLGVWLAGDFLLPGPTKSALEGLLLEGGAHLAGSASELLALDSRIQERGSTEAGRSNSRGFHSPSPSQQVLYIIVSPDQGTEENLRKDKNPDVQLLMEAIAQDRVRLRGYLWVLDAITNYQLPTS